MVINLGISVVKIIICRCVLFSGVGFMDSAHAGDVYTHKEQASLCV